METQKIENGKEHECMDDDYGLDNISVHTVRRQADNGFIYNYDRFHVDVTTPSGKVIIKDDIHVYLRVEGKQTAKILKIIEQVGSYSMATMVEGSSTYYDTKQQPFYYILTASKSDGKRFLVGYRTGTKSVTGKRIANGTLHEGMYAEFSTGLRSLEVKPVD